MDWKKIIAAIYIVAAIVAGVVFTAGTFASGTTATEQENEDLKALEESRTKITQLESQLDEMASKVNEAENERASLEVEKEDLAKEVETLKAEAETKAAEEAKAAEEEAAKEEEDKKSEEEEKKEDKEKEGPFYTYKINTSSGPLRLYSKKSGGSSTARAPKGYKGYVIDTGKSSDRRALILYKGKLYYASKSLLKLTEIDADDYPDKVAALSASDIGEKFFRGKAVGIEKKK